MSISRFLKVNRHEIFQIFDRPDFLDAKYVLQNYLFLSENCKNDIFGKGDRGFQIFTQNSVSLVHQSHTWKYWYVCSDEYGIKL